MDHTQAEILRASVTFVNRPLATPLVLSSGAITEATQATAEVAVRVGAKEATGRGSIYLSDLWAWPDPSLSHGEKDRSLRRLCEEIAGDLRELCGGEPAHPLELGLRLHDNVCRQPVPPVLARAVCASPFDAAIHDAAGIALGRSAFEFYKEYSPLPTADAYFADGNACAAIGRVIRPPKSELNAWYIVGKNDSMEDDVAPWIRDRGYRCFKIKVLGRDNRDDVARTVEVFRAVRSLGVSDPWLSVDANEANPDAASVLDYLERLSAADAEAFAALRYLEQPTGRDITVHKFDWRPVTALKPVILDEGLTGLDLMGEAALQGWSGFALKTCRGHSLNLVAAAWAKERDLLLAFQDLTNPGPALIHAALFAAHMPTINGIELNSPQFTPAANEDWLPRLSGLFDPTGGVHRLPEKTPAGLGSTL